MTIDIYKYQNPGIYINETDTSLYTAPKNFGVTHFVVGFSKKGPQNIAILIQTKENFYEIFGDIDRTLEKKDSYFHRTVLELLETGPVICMSLLLTNKDRDRLNWKSLSAASQDLNTLARSTSYEEFYDRTGFWKRDPDIFNNIAKKYKSDSVDKYFHIVNMGSEVFTIFTYKSDITGFDITFEDWYKSNDMPTWAHPKDLISDYLIKVIAIKGDWTNYKILSTDPYWKKYFSKQGLKKEQANSFYNDNLVKIIKIWNGSLIPYFEDNSGRTMWIQSLINNDLNETGVFVSFDIELIETEFKTNKIDLLGANLVSEKEHFIDFLSYKERIVDKVIIPETEISQEGNSWGGHNWITGRSNEYAEGYVHNVKMKPLIISQTSTLKVKPLITTGSSYAIINGNKIDLSWVSPEIILLLPELSNPGEHFCLTVYLDSEGVKFKTGNPSPDYGSLYLPPIDPIKEYVLGYYRINQTISGAYITEVYGVSVDTNDWISPFRIGSENDPKINTINYSETWQTGLIFETIEKMTGDNYHQDRIYYFWNKLLGNIIEKESIILDTDGFKQIIDWIEPGIDGSDKTVRIAVQNKASNVQTWSVLGNIVIYYQDIEFIFQNETHLETEPDPFVVGSGGIVGRDSYMYKSYFDGTINTGDKVFLEIAHEYEVTFITSDNSIEFKTLPIDNYDAYQRIFVSGTQFNDGVFTVLQTANDGNTYKIYVEQTVVSEMVSEIITFDANVVRFLNFYLVNDMLYVKYENSDEDISNLNNLNILETDKFKKTLEIEKIISPYEILVDANRYGGKIQIGDYLLADWENDAYLNTNPRNWTRVLDATRWNNDPTFLYIQTDSPVKVRDNNADYQTDWFIEIDKWIKTYKGHKLVGFNIKDDSLPNGTEERLNQILNLVSKGTGLFKASTNQDTMKWRYLTDSFGLGLTSNSKQQLADLCEQHNSIGFLNVPSIKYLKKSITPDFKVDGSFSTELFKIGGKRDLTGGTTYSIATGTASSHVAYFFPYVIINDEVQNRPILIPPAAYVAKTFMQKWESPLNYAWNVSAGFDLGEIFDIAGVEKEFLDSELNDINSMQINPIATRNLTDYVIHTNNTAANRSSALSKINVREALISLEEELKEMLITYQWTINNASNRAEIEKRANKICIHYLEQNAIGNFSNKMNIQNNTNEVIDAQMGILDTYVEPVFGMAAIVLNIAVYRTGQVATLAR